MTTGEEGMRDSEMGVDHPDVIYKDNTSPNNNGSGSPAFSSDHSANANTSISDSSSTNGFISNGINLQRASDLLFGFSIHAEPTKTKIIEYACLAMDELYKIGNTGEPLWQHQQNDKHEILNDIEYLRQFGQVDTTLREIVKLIEVGEPQTLPNFDSYQFDCPTSKATPSAALQIEASRDLAYVNMTPTNVVELLMDMNKWSSVFYHIVSKTTILGTLLDGVEGSYDGKLHVMNTELHLPSPVVPTRECCFGRYCRQLSNEEWGVVDVSLDKFFSSPNSNFLKRPSGCLITGMPNEYSKVVWVEHVEADHSQLENFFRTFVTSSLGFGATRWLASIVQYSEWSQSLKATALVADNGVYIPQSGRRSFLKLGDRMMRTFCANISGTTSNPWMQIGAFPGSPDVRVMVKSDPHDAAKLPGTTVIFATSVWLQVSPNRLFNFLRNANSRPKWDSLSSRLCIREFASIMRGENPGNRVSLMRANTAEGKLEIFYVQESCTNSTGSYVVYAPLDELAMRALARGCNPEKVIMLPSGFTILPGRDDSGTEGSILTVAFDIIESFTTRPFIPEESVETIYKIITDTITSIKDVVLYHNLRNNWMED